MMQGLQGACSVGEAEQLMKGMWICSLTRCSWGSTGDPGSGE